MQRLGSIELTQGLHNTIYITNNDLCLYYMFDSIQCGPRVGRTCYSDTRLRDRDPRAMEDTLLYLRLQAASVHVVKP